MSTSFVNGGPEVMGGATLLDTLIRTPGTVAEVEREVARRLADGSLKLTGTFCGREREVAAGVLTDAR